MAEGLGKIGPPAVTDVGVTPVGSAGGAGTGGQQGCDEALLLRELHVGLLMSHGWVRSGRPVQGADNR